jgi:hypothetical protein
VKKWFFYILLLINSTLFAQDTSFNKESMLHHFKQEHDIRKRKLTIAGIHVSAYAGTLLLLSQAWYKDHPKASFHTFDDSKEWLQVDKVGHGWTAYNIAHYSSGMWKWAGYHHKKAVLLGGLSSIGYQTILETLDAYSAEWGWSWTDMAANISGSGMYTIQELIWGEQKLQFKFSSFPAKYPQELQSRANTLYGTSLPEKILKDYNGQTYWLSANMHSFFKKDALPKWLNMAVGYGAKGLYGGFENKAIDKNGIITFDRRDIPRQRQWYISPDIDFTKINTHKKGFKILFSLMNMIKMPAPALEFSKGKWKGHLIYF